MTTSLFASGFGTLLLYPIGFVAGYALLAKKRALLATCLAAVAYILLFVRTA